ncbi:HD domain-containing protein [Streptococcus ovuberis]|uniref:HD domain-containing protein n=1 Tax=Streptococcus ovuberis TaxID=1936207 RepID=A0A7X6MYL9_9STRE|nr:HD domain-containing protein [Streptococcus ovuberis]NKZ20114.1 HD domain-containing protein [Streptococcus ovuberis]
MDRTQKETIQVTENHVRQLCQKDSSGHDWWHIERVRRTALTIAGEEGANHFICEMAALLHDVADRKFNDSLIAGLEKVEAWLNNQPLAKEDKDHILEIIETMSFTSQKEGKAVPSLEGQVVQDADRLDALGAIGIARTMAYSGHTGRLIYHPDSDEETAVQHFYDKLLTLKGLMNTNYGKRLAEQRHHFMESYLEQFYAEWSGQR